MFWFTLMLSPTNSLFFLVRSARRHSQKIDLLYLQLYFEELRSDKLSHKHDSNKYQSKAFLIRDHRSDKYRSATHVNKTYLVWLWGLLRASVSFSTLQTPPPPPPPPRYSCFCSLPCFLDELTLNRLLPRLLIIRRVLGSMVKLKNST